MISAKKCTFCGKDILLGQGVMFVRNDGTVQYYCSSKCRKNSLVLKRDPRKFKWAQPLHKHM